MKTRSPIRSGVVAAAVALAANGAGAALLQNGSFEAAAIPDGTLKQVAPDGWSGGAVIMNPLDNGVIPGNAFIWPQAVDGQQFEDIGNSPLWALSQSFQIASAERYAFTWWDNVGGVPALPGFRTAPYLVTLVDAQQQAVFAAAFDSYRDSGQWLQRNVTRDLAAGTYTLTFASQNIPNHTDSLIDAVDVSPAPVPEPGQGLLLILGLAGLATWRRCLGTRG